MTFARIEADRHGVRGAPGKTLKLAMTSLTPYNSEIFPSCIRDEHHLLQEYISARLLCRKLKNGVSATPHAHSQSLKIIEPRVHCATERGRIRKSSRQYAHCIQCVPRPKMAVCVYSPPSRTYTHTHTSPQFIGYKPMLAAARVSASYSLAQCPYTTLAYTQKERKSKKRDGEAHKGAAYLLLSVRRADRHHARRPRHTYPTPLSRYKRGRKLRARAAITSFSLAASERANEEGPNHRIVTHVYIYIGGERVEGTRACVQREFMYIAREGREARMLLHIYTVCSS